MTLATAKRIAAKWDANKISATAYYCAQCRIALQEHRDNLTNDELSLIIGLVEYYNMNQ